LNCRCFDGVEIEQFWRVSKKYGNRVSPIDPLTKVLLLFEPLDRIAGLEAKEAARPSRGPRSSLPNLEIRDEARPTQRPPEDLSKRVHALSDGELQAAINGPKRTTNPLFAKAAQQSLRAG